MCRCAAPAVEFDIGLLVRVAFLEPALCFDEVFFCWRDCVDREKDRYKGAGLVLGGRRCRIISGGGREWVYRFTRGFIMYTG